MNIDWKGVTMGLLLAAAGAVGGVFADQWKEYFYCESLDKNTLVVKGQHRIGGRSSNRRGNDNIISNGSVISVSDGQCMIIVEQGKVVELCAEPGEYVYDKSTEPSIFSGRLGDSIIESFKTMGKRFTFGGDTGKDQRVYYFNTKEMGEILYGTASPIPFRVIVNEELGYKLSVDIRCNGNFTYRISDPILFYTNVCGNVSDKFETREIDARLKGELMTALQPALAKISAMNIQYYEIPAHTDDVASALNDVLSETWKKKRGIEVYSFNINSLSIPDNQRRKLTEWEETAMTTNINTAAARLAGAQAEALKSAAKNEAGAMSGFLGMGMALNQGGMNASELFAQAQNQGQNAANQFEQAQNQGRDALKQGMGSTKNEADGWVCTNCGTLNRGKFCQECGHKKPAHAPLYQCDKCGWEPPDPTNPPKFCPECGDRFDENDIK